MRCRASVLGTARHQELPFTSLHRLSILIDNPHLQVNRPPTQSGHRFRLLAGNLHVDGIPEEDGLAKLPRQLTKRECRTVNEAQTGSQSSGNGKDQHTVGYALAEHETLGELLVCVQLVVITGHPGESNHVGLSDGTTGTDDLYSNFEFLEIHATWHRSIPPSDMKVQITSAS